MTIWTFDMVRTDSVRHLEIVMKEQDRKRRKRQSLAMY